MRKDAKQKAIEAAMDSFSASLDELNDTERQLTRSMLETWCWLDVQIVGLEQMVNRDGALIETEKGLKEHPAISTIHKLSQRKSDYYTKLVRKMKDTDKEQFDELTAFLREVS